MTHHAARNAQGARGRIPVWVLVALAGAVAVVFAVYFGIELASNGEPGFPLDDSWIHLTFARNLARGWGLAFNQGEQVQGSSAPLWTAMLAFLHLFTRNGTVMVWLAKLLGAGLLFVSGVFAYRLARLLTGNRWAGLGAGLAVVTISHLGWALMSGMEVLLSVVLTLAGVYCYLKEPGDGSNQRSAFSMLRSVRAHLPWVLFGIGVYVRPEFLALPAFLAVDWAARRLCFGQRDRPGRFWRGLLAFAVVVAPYFVLNLALAHSPFPATYAAKVGRLSLLGTIVERNQEWLGRFLFKYPLQYFTGYIAYFWRANPILCILAGVGVIVLVVTAFNVRHRGKASLLIPLLVLGYLPMLGFVAHYGGPAFQHGRYVGNVVALTAVTAIVGGQLVLSSIRKKPIRIGVLGLLAGLALFNTTSTGIAMAHITARASASINRLQVLLGRWLSENTPEDAVIACNDVGAIGYYSNRRLIDLLGLVTPEIMAYRRKWPAGQEKLSALEFIIDEKPDYLVVFPNWFPNLKEAEFLVPICRVDVPDNTASRVDFRPRPRLWAGILVLGLDVEPVPAQMVVVGCDWSGQQE